MPSLSRRRFLGAAGLGAAALSLPGWSRRAAAADRPPNVILILADDLGFGQFEPDSDQFTLDQIDPLTISKIGGKYSLEAAAEAARNACPTLTQLAAEGVRMTDAYVPCSLCAPSRCGLLTSRSPSTMGIYVNVDLERNGVPRDQLFLPALLQQNGYTTAHIGKWHLANGAAKGEMPKPGEHQLDRGFDHCFAFNMHGTEYYDSPLLYRDREPAKAEGYLTDQWTAEADRFIRGAGDRPFFLYLAYNAVHGPLNKPAPKQYLDRFKTGNPMVDNFYAYLYAMDTGIGRLRRTLTELGQDRQTLILFLSDNGAAGGSPAPANGPFLGYKGQLWQGGLRVPLVAWGPGVAAGQLCHEMVSSLDLLPTALGAAGVPLPDGDEVEGRSLLPLLRNPQSGPVHDKLIWIGQLAKKWAGEGKIADELTAPGAWAVRKGTWLLRYWAHLPQFELYDMVADKGERRNVAAQHADVVRDLQAEFAAWWPKVKKPVAWKEANWQALAPQGA